MNKDLQGNTLTGATADAVTSYDQAVRSFNIYRGDPEALIDAAIAAAPEFATAHLFKAGIYATASEPEATAGAAEILGHAESLSMNDREQSLAAALKRLVAGHWNAAAEALDRHNMLYPHDLPALQFGHLLDFYRGNARNLRDRIARALPHWSADQPGYSILLGMQSFGHEEMADYRRAEEFGRHAVELEPQDCWAHHAVAHVMEMTGRSEDGIGWMIAREPHWSGKDNLFAIHNWWHKALFHLDLGQVAAVLALYDGPIREDKGGVVLDLVDASALLWRLHLSGHDVGDRWQELSRAWEAQSDGALYAFNDWHAAMAHLGAGRDDVLDSLVGKLTRTASATDNGDAAMFAGAIGLPLIEGFAAFFRGDHATAVDRLVGVRYLANRFGGSHAQRDIIDWTLIEAALRGGDKAVATSLANERLAGAPHSPVNLGFLKRAQSKSVAAIAA